MVLIIQLVFAIQLADVERLQFVGNNERYLEFFLITVIGKDRCSNDKVLVTKFDLLLSCLEPEKGLVCLKLIRTWVIHIIDIHFLRVLIINETNLVGLNFLDTTCPCQML